jgi:hypothetical protein
VPVVALTAHSDEPPSRPPPAAGMNGFLVKPVERLCCTTRWRGWSAPAAGDAGPSRAGAPRRWPHESLLNLPAAGKLPAPGHAGRTAERLRAGDGAAGETPAAGRAKRDVQGSIDALHSLLGMSGEAGAQALYQQVRKLYVPLLEEGEWPAATWLPQLQDLARGPRKPEGILRARRAASEHACLKIRCRSRSFRRGPVHPVRRRRSRPRASGSRGIRR